MGSNVETMSAEHHDLVLAITSHVPHLIAYNIVGTAADLEEVTQSEVIKFSAGGFRDFTRIAASDPTMWRDIFLNNRDAVLEMLGRFNEDLSALPAHDPLGRRRGSVRPVHPHPGHPAQHRGAGPGDGGAGFRPAAPAGGIGDRRPERSDPAVERDDRSRNDCPTWGGTGASAEDP